VILLNIIQSNELPNEEKSRQVLPDRLLQVGMVNDRVRRLQEALGLIPDGEFGPSTLRAVFERQQELGIKVDGVVGPATLDALGLDGKLD
jgi:peptidoglycan hydrolase-like protein with peptidoglycan-binding domain